MRSISSAHEDFISSSIPIQSGRPDVYQLRPKKETFGTVTKKTIGVKDEKKTNKTILLVGETGTGKSALINALVNYSMGVKWEDGVWFQIVEEEEERRSQTESQTSDVMVYQIFEFEGKTLPYSLTIIDTPGFGDTRGTEHDDIISQRLLDLFGSEDGVHEINAVGLVMKASENRLSDRLMYVFEAVMSLFGKNVEEKIVALITHSDGERPDNAFEALKVAEIKCARNETNEPIYFLFNNNQKKQRNAEEGAVSPSKNAWDLTNTQNDCLKKFLSSSKPQKLEQTVEVLKERIRLTACIQNLQDRIKETELKQREISQIKEALKKNEEEMEKNQNFIVEVDEVYKEKEDIYGGMRLLVFYKGAVCCTVCEETCHFPGCTMAWYPKHCQVMKDGRCTVCTRKCPASVHVKETWKYVTKTRRVQKTLKDVKKKYEEKKSEGNKKKSVLEKVEEEMKKLISDKSDLLDEAYQHVIRLEQIALNVDSLFVYVHLDFLIEKMKENNDTEKVQKLEKMQSKEDEGTRSSQIKMSRLKALKIKLGNKLSKQKKEERK